jgi:hypothetical protein
MARSTPVIATEVPGNFVISALWNAQVAATMQWLFGTGSNGVPRFKGYASTAQPIAGVASGTNPVDVPINLDTEVYDSEGGHSTTTNPSRYTCQVPGLYRLTAVGGFPTNGTGDRKVGININGVPPPGSVVQGVPSSARSWSACVSVEQYLNAGDYVEMVMWQTNTTALNTAVFSGYGPALSVWWIGNN